MSIVKPARAVYPNGYSKRPCRVCGTSQIMKDGVDVCDECRNGVGMTFQQYASAAHRTNSYPRGMRMHDLVMGLCSESGECAGLAKKIDRDSGAVWDDADKRHMALELGDVLWYVAELAHEFGYTLPQIARMNIDKLADRAKRGRIGGSGDDR